MHLLILLTPIIAGLVSGRLLPRLPTAAAIPWVSIAMVAVVAAMLALQLRFPVLLDLLSRQPSLIGSGQIWRAITALFVQDGGLAGGLFNLILLLAIGPIAESRLGSKRWAISYIYGGIVTELLALAWQPHGAGNSIACFALAGALAMTCLMRRRDWLAAGAAGVGLTSVAALVVLRDIHGIGFLAGTLIGAIFAWRDRWLAVQALPSAGQAGRAV